MRLDPIAAGWSSTVREVADQSHSLSEIFAARWAPRGRHVVLDVKSGAMLHTLVALECVRRGKRVATVALVRKSSPSGGNNITIAYRLDEVHPVDEALPSSFIKHEIAPRIWALEERRKICGKQATKQLSVRGELPHPREAASFGSGMENCHQGSRLYTFQFPAIKQPHAGYQALDSWLVKQLADLPVCVLNTPEPRFVCDAPQDYHVHRIHQLQMARRGD